MDIFELVDNEKFFHPLSSQNRRIYYECILSLIEKSRKSLCCTIPTPGTAWRST